MTAPLSPSLIAINKYWMPWKQIAASSHNILACAYPGLPIDIKSSWILTTQFYSYLPYCIHPVSEDDPAGKQIILNFNYKPLGIVGKSVSTQVEYPLYTSMHVRPSDLDLDALYFSDIKAEPRKTHLYRKAVLPWSSQDECLKYLSRLDRVFKLQAK